jgi:hypothetical protein
VSARGNDRRPTKAERKEEARQEREEIQRKQAKRKRNRVVSLVVGLAIGAVVIGGLVLFGGGTDQPPPAASASTAPGGLPLPDPATLPGVMQTPPLWANNVADANARLAMLGLPELSDTVLHLHVRLFIYVDGEPVIVPADVGYSQQTQVFSPLHTHDETGTLHVESADPNFEGVLGQFMDVWGLYFTPTCLGDACNDGDRQLRVYVNGQLYAGDPTLLPLNDQEAVVVTMGTEAQLPNPIPDSFTFNANG